MRTNLNTNPIIRWSMAFFMTTGLFVPFRNLPDNGQQNGSAIVTEVLDGRLSLEREEVRQAIIELAPGLEARQKAELMLRLYEQIIAPSTDLDAFAHLAELAAGLNGRDVDGFVLELSRLTLDATSNGQAILAGPLGRLKQRMHYHFRWFPGSPALTRFGSSGFAADDGSNQVQHFWYSVALAYRWGGSLAEWGARYHEWNAPGILKYLPGTGGGRGSAMDMTLSRQGIELGRALAEGNVSPAQVGQWLQENLSGKSVKTLTFGEKSV